jgi:hypothetical protein
MKLNEVHNIDEAMMAGGQEAYATEAKPDAYTRDQMAATAGFGRRPREHDTGDDEPKGVFTVVIDGRDWKTATSNEAFRMANAVAHKHPGKRVQVRWPTGQLNTVAEGLAMGMEEEFVGEPEHDGSTFKNSLHTIHRVAVYLNKNISDDDDIPEWVAEKMGAAKGMLTSVMQYLISEKEMHHGEADIYEQGVAEGAPQSMGTALTNALSKVEPGSKLDKKIRHHNDMVRRFGPEAGTMTSAPDGYRIDKKGFIRLGQGVAEGYARSNPFNVADFKRHMDSVTGSIMGRAPTNKYQVGQVVKYQMEPAQAGGSGVGKITRVSKSGDHYEIDGSKIVNHYEIKGVEQGVAEGMNDTVYPNAQVIKSKNGKPVGEIYQDANGWGCFHYRADRGYDGIDSREDAIAALKDLHQEIGRSRPDYTIKGVAEGELTEASVKHVMGRYQVVHNGKVVGTYNAKYEAQDRANHLNDTAKRMPRGNYSDEANPIRDDGNELPDYAAMYENKLVEFAGGMGTGSVATAPGVGKGSNVGSLFGGSYSQKNSPFKKTKAKKESVIKR